MNWIYNLVKKSEEDNLCIRTGCTTCGSSEFRNLLMIQSAKEAGIYNEKLNSLKLSDLDKERKKAKLYFKSKPENKTKYLDNIESAIDEEI